MMTPFDIADRLKHIKSLRAQGGVFVTISAQTAMDKLTKDVLKEIAYNNSPDPKSLCQALLKWD